MTRLPTLASTSRRVESGQLGQVLMRYDYSDAHVAGLAEQVAQADRQPQIVLELIEIDEGWAAASGRN